MGGSIESSTHLYGRFAILIRIPYSPHLFRPPGEELRRGDVPPHQLKSQGERGVGADARTAGGDG